MYVFPSFRKELGKSVFKFIHSISERGLSEYRIRIGFEIQRQLTGQGGSEYIHIEWVIGGHCCENKSGSPWP
jgi:hypothetical protein